MSRMQRSIATLQVKARGRTDNREAGFHLYRSFARYGDDCCGDDCYGDDCHGDDCHS